MTTATTEVSTRVSYQANAPVASPQNLKALLETQKQSIQSVLPKHITPERLFKTMLVAINRVPNLLKCTQASVLETINRAGELGLDLSGTLGEAYPVPYGNTCQLIIGYRGLAKLARQTGEVATITADLVCQNDRFTFRKGGNAICEWEPPLQGERGQPIGAFAHVQFKDGTQQFDYMTVDEINAIKSRSRSGNSGPWQTDWAEMAKKTVFRRLSKWLPLSAEKWTQAMEHDDATAGVVEDDLPQLPRSDGQSKTDAVMDAVIPEEAPEVAPAEEAPQGGLTAKHDELVVLLANKQNCTPEEAEDAIRNYCRTSVWACDLEDLTAARLKELKKVIEKGEIVAG